MEDFQQARKFAERLLHFINSSPSPFHAVETCQRHLEKSGFKRLSERSSWAGEIKPNGRYYFTRNHSSIVAFCVGGKFDNKNGLKIIGAHTDSPNLMVKPVSATSRLGFQQVSVSTYGGGLWHTWFDRDLKLAGRVVLQTASGLESKLVHINRPILRVPNLCIHLQSADERTAFKVNKEDHICPILCTNIVASLEQPSPSTTGKHNPVLINLIANELGCAAENILDFELSLSDYQPASLGGAFDEFIFSPRLDNLASCFCSLEALTEGENLEEESQCRVVALFDNEEVGSDSAAGAGSTHLVQLLERLRSGLSESVSEETKYIAASNSFMISADMAHAVHPCYGGKHHDLHRPEIHKGVVFKFSYNQRYSSTASSSAIIRHIASKHSIPIQEFTVGNETPCGSTIGPILSTRTGIKTLDLGLPQLSMHSIRETCGTLDLVYYFRLFKAFFSEAGPFVVNGE